MTSKEIFDKFKKLCPNSAEHFVDTSANVTRWTKHILHIERLELYKQHNPPIIANALVARAYKAASGNRKFKNKDNIPEYIKATLDGHIIDIRKAYPDTTKIYLTGSYARGNYIDSRTTQEFRELKRTATLQNVIKISDFDYMIVPNLSKMSEALGDIHLIADNGTTKLLIWQKEKLIRN